MGNLKKVTHFFVFSFKILYLYLYIHIHKLHLVIWKKSFIFVPMINVTYAITVCNELTEITTLIDFLKDKIGEEDEILIQYDSDSTEFWK